MEDSRKKEFEDYITECFPPGSKRSTSGVVYAAFGAAGYEAGRYALTEYLTGFKAGWGATNGCNPVSRLRSRSAGFEAGCPLRSGSGCESGRNIYTILYFLALIYEGLTVSMKVLVRPYIYTSITCRTLVCVIVVLNLNNFRAAK